MQTWEFLRVPDIVRGTKGGNGAGLVPPHTFLRPDIIVPYGPRGKYVQNTREFLNV